VSKPLVKPVVFLASRWRVWSPPVIFAIIVFVGAVLLSQGKEALTFVYRIF
jgi:hypothetical protein